MHDDNHHSGRTDRRGYLGEGVILTEVGGVEEEEVRVGTLALYKSASLVQIALQTPVSEIPISFSFPSHIVLCATQESHHAE